MFILYLPPFTDPTDGRSSATREIEKICASIVLVELGGIRWLIAYKVKIPSKIVLMLKLS